MNKIIHFNDNLDINNSGTARVVLDMLEIRKSDIALVLNKNKNKKNKRVFSLFSFKDLAKFKKEFEHTNYIFIHNIWSIFSILIICSCIVFNKKYLVFTHGFLDSYFFKNSLKKYKKIIYIKIFGHLLFSKSEFTIFSNNNEEKKSKSLLSSFKYNPKNINLGSLSPKITNLNNITINKPKLNKPFILILGRIDKKKGIHLALNAFVKVFDKVNFDLVIAGKIIANDRYYLFLKKIIELNNLAERVHFVGEVKYPLKQYLLSNCKFLLLPSYGENFGLVISESLSLSRPVIVSNKVDISDIINRYNAGFVIKPDENSLIDIYIKICKIKSFLYRKLISNSIKCYKNEFNFSNNYKKFIKNL